MGYRFCCAFVYPTSARNAEAFFLKGLLLHTVKNWHSFSNQGSIQ